MGVLGTGIDPRNEFALLHAACSAELGPKHGAWERDFLGYGTSDKTRERDISTAYLRNGLVNEKCEKDMLWNGWQGVKRGVLRADILYCHYT